MGQPLRLHDVDDAALLVARLVSRAGLRLSYHDREELEQHLLIEAWKLSERYEAGRAIEFGAWATVTLRKRIIDWQRQRLGRTKWKFAGRIHERPRVELVSLDAPGGDQLGATLSARTGDSPAGGDEDLRGLFVARDRSRARDLATLGL